MSEHYKFFQNKECEYFPCHKGVPEDEFNCLFCYCPLYLLGDACGGNFHYNAKGYKDCTNCTIPHRRQNYEKITGRYADIVRAMPSARRMLPLSVALEQKDFSRMLQKYHFQDSDQPLLQDNYALLLPHIHAKGYFALDVPVASITYDSYALGLVTLGNGIDELQQEYTKQQNLTESYMLDCLGLELLSKSYQEVVKEVQRMTDKWVTSIDFLGDTYPLSLLPKFFEILHPEDISYNRDFMLTPLKSVSFLLPLSDTKTEHDVCNLCTHCGNEQCILRHAPEN